MPKNSLVKSNLVGGGSVCWGNVNVSTLKEKKKEWGGYQKQHRHGKEKHRLSPGRGYKVINDSAVWGIWHYKSRFNDFADFLSMFFPLLLICWGCKGEPGFTDQCLISGVRRKSKLSAVLWLWGQNYTKICSVLLLKMYHKPGGKHCPFLCGVCLFFLFFSVCFYVFLCLFLPCSSRQVSRLKQVKVKLKGSILALLSWENKQSGLFIKNQLSLVTMTTKQQLFISCV